MQTRPKSSCRQSSWSNDFSAKEIQSFLKTRKQSQGQVKQSQQRYNITRKNEFVRQFLNNLSTSPLKFCKSFQRLEESPKVTPLHLKRLNTVNLNISPVSILRNYGYQKRQNSQFGQSDNDSGLITCQSINNQVFQVDLTDKTKRSFHEVYIQKIRHEQRQKQQITVSKAIQPNCFLFVQGRSSKMDQRYVSQEKEEKNNSFLYNILYQNTSPTPTNTVQSFRVMPFQSQRQQRTLKSPIGGNDLKVKTQTSVFQNPYLQKILKEK